MQRRPRLQESIKTIDLIISIKGLIMVSPAQNEPLRDETYLPDESAAATLRWAGLPSFGFADSN